MSAPIRPASRPSRSTSPSKAAQPARHLQRRAQQVALLTELARSIAADEGGEDGEVARAVEASKELLLRENWESTDGHKVQNYIEG